jgi:Txe/YoeB family toxin of Txe-Axe toxin-antitoxin module
MKNGPYQYVESKTALQDKKILKSMSKAVKSKFEYLFDDILEYPDNLNTVGNPEELKYRNNKTFSRELTKKDRIVYEIRKGDEFEMPEEDEIVVFLQYLGHYEDK